MSYRDEIKAHAKTGCAGEVSIIGVLAIYICIHQPSVYAERSSPQNPRVETSDVRSILFPRSSSLLSVVSLFSALRSSDPFFQPFSRVTRLRDTPITYRAARNAMRYVLALFRNSAVDARASFRFVRASSLFLESHEERRTYRFLLASPRSSTEILQGLEALSCRIRLKYLNEGTILRQVFCPVIYGIYTVINYVVYHELLLLKLHLSGGLEKNSSSKSTVERKQQDLFQISEINKRD